MEDKTTNFFRFEDLRIYTKALDYNRWLLKHLPQSTNDCERKVIESLCCSSMDIALNIVEGSSRNKTQFDQYLRVAKTAMKECLVYTEIAFNIGLIDTEDRQKSRDYITELMRMISALIISLQRSVHRQKERTFDEEFSQQALEYDSLDSQTSTLDDAEPQF